MSQSTISNGSTTTPSNTTTTPSPEYFDNDFRKQAIVRINQILEILKGYGNEFPNQHEMATKLELKVCLNSKTKEQYLQNLNAILDRLKSKIPTTTSEPTIPTISNYPPPTTTYQTPTTYSTTNTQQQWPNASPGTPVIHNFQEFCSYLKHLPVQSLLELLWNQRQRLIQQDLQIGLLNSEVQRLTMPTPSTPSASGYNTVSNKDPLCSGTMFPSNNSHHTTINAVDQYSKKRKFSPPPESYAMSYSDNRPNIPNNSTFSFPNRSVPPMQTTTTSISSTGTNPSTIPGLPDNYWNRLSALKQKHLQNMIYLRDNLSNIIQLPNREWFQKSITIVIQVLMDLEHRHENTSLPDLSRVQSFIELHAQPLLDQLQLSNVSSTNPSGSSSSTPTNSTMTSSTTENAENANTSSNKDDPSKSENMVLKSISSLTNQSDATKL